MKPHRARRGGAKQGFTRSFSEVADAWFEKTGQKLTQERIRQICTRALKKLRRAFEDVAA